MMNENKYIITVEITDTRENIKAGKYEPEENICECAEVTDLRSFLLPMADFLYSIK